MATVDLYAVLNLPHDCSLEDIKKSYRQLVKKYHPDRPSGDKDLFELITDAYNVLSNTESRIEYDKIFNISRQSDSGYVELKVQHENFEILRQTDVNNLSREESKIAFDKEYIEFDKKHGYKRNPEDVDPLTKEVGDINLMDRMSIREQEDTETMHERLFIEGQFDPIKFNAAFDMMKKRGMGYDLVPHEGNPEAYNAESTIGYTDINNASNIYAEDVLDACLDYAPIEKTSEYTALSKDDVEDLAPVSYVMGHNQDRDQRTMEQRLNDRMQQRSTMNTQFDARTMDDFDTDPTCGGYGILHQVGVGTNQSLQWNTDEDVKTRYERLLKERRGGV